MFVVQVREGIVLFLSTKLHDTSTCQQEGVIACAFDENMQNFVYPEEQQKLFDSTCADYVRHTVLILS